MEEWEEDIMDFIVMRINKKFLFRLSIICVTLSVLLWTHIKAYEYGYGKAFELASEWIKGNCSAAQEQSILHDGEPGKNKDMSL